MRILDLNRWRAAHQLMKSHGDHAGFQAGLYAGEQLKKGDKAGFEFWMDIAFKIARLEKCLDDLPLN